MKFKNVAGQYVDLDDLRRRMAPEEVIDSDDLNPEEYARSEDLPEAITAGQVVYLDQTTEQPLTQAESEEVNQTDATNVSPTTMSEVAAYIQSLNLGGGTGEPPMPKISDIVDMPATTAYAKQLKAGSKVASTSKNFFSDLLGPDYRNVETLNKQTLLEVGGPGIFTGIMLPQLDSDNGTDRAITIYITIDEVQTFETFVYHDKNDKYNRLYLGQLTGAARGDLKRPTALLTHYPDLIEGSVYSDRRPQTFPTMVSSMDAHVPSPMCALSNTGMPRMEFESSLKVEYELSESGMYTGKSYGNRAVAFYLAKY